MGQKYWGAKMLGKFIFRQKIYMAARVGFEPATFRTQDTEPTNEPPRHIYKVKTLFGVTTGELQMTENNEDYLFMHNATK